jgi:hypothetical protein
VTSSNAAKGCCLNSVSQLYGGDESTENVLSNLFLMVCTLSRKKFANRSGRLTIGKVAGRDVHSFLHISLLVI